MDFLAGIFGEACRSNYAFTVSGFPDHAFSVLGFTGSDHALSGDYRFTVELLAPSRIDPSTVLGKAALLEPAPGSSPVHGIVASFTSAGELPDGHLHIASLVSPLHLLCLGRSNRVFIGRSAPQILEEIARAAGLTVRLSLREEYPTREFTVQFDESDFAFLQRLAAGWGIFHRFEQGSEGATLLFHDTLEDLARHPVPLVYRQESGELRPEGTVFSLRPRAQLLAAEVELRDYSYRTPETPLRASAGAAATGAGRLVRSWENAKDLPEAERLARLRQQALDGARESFLAETDCRDLSPGLHITVLGHPELDGDYLVLGIDHRGDQRAGFAYGDGVKGPTYRNVLHLIRAGVPWRPPVPAERRFHGTMIARVESPGGDYPHLDEQGRYRVRLGFDDGDAPPAGASHPVRAMQPYGGSDYGLHLPLHAGTEVLLACVGGHLDRPVILGALPNPATPTPVAAANPSQNILRTAGGNELLLDDRKGKEKIELFTAGRKNILALDADGQGHTVRLATAEGKMEVSAAQTLLLSSGDTGTLQSGADHLITVENAHRLTASEGEIAQQAAADIRMRAGENIQIQSEAEDIVLACGENLIAQAGEEMSLEVRSGDLELLVESGSLTLKASGAVSILGEGGGAICIGQGAGEIAIAPNGDITIEASEVEIVGDTVALQGGQNSQGGGGGGANGASFGGVSLASLSEYHNPLFELYKADTSKSIPPDDERKAALEAKKMRLAERNDLIKRGRAKAEHLPASERTKLLTAADRLELNNRAVEYARLSADVYNDPGVKEPPVGWNRSSNDPKDLPPALRNAIWEDSASGFRAALYKSEIDGSKCLVFRGTVNKPGWKNNASQALGYEAEQYKQAINLATDVGDTYSEGFHISGHSLGGGLTSAGCAVTGAKGFIFNASGLHPNTVASYGVTRAEADSLIHSYKVGGEVLSTLQSPLVNIAAAPLGTGVRYIRQANPVSLYKSAFGDKPLNLHPVWIYDAVGKTHDLPAVDAEGNPSSILRADPVERHKMEYVINGIEKQKRDDMNELKKNPN